MPGFSAASFAERRPFLYHLTARSNLESIASCGELLPAMVHLELAGARDWIRARRTSHLQLRSEAGSVHLRDQRPFHRGHLDLNVNWSFEDAIEDLNRRVFFWPGAERGPSECGRAHFARYSAEGPAILRVPTPSLLASNNEIEPEYCAFNSGAPRTSGGRKSPRGPMSFAAASSFGRPPSKVVEVTFRGAVSLPADTFVAGLPTGPWEPLAFIPRTS